VYIPDYYNLSDTNVVFDVMRKYSFVTLLTPVKDDIMVSEIPVTTARTGKSVEIRGHLAKHNPHSEVVFRGKSTVLFHGPHHYISPRWYLTPKTVPTWDYILIKVTGLASRLSDLETRMLLKELSDGFDPEWSSEGHENEGYYDEMTGDVRGFKIASSDILAKAKLNQNHPTKNILNVIKNLENSDPEGQQLASFMKLLAVKK
jgi:transcriptional regulator